MGTTENHESRKRRILVTGCTRGLGRAMTLYFHEAGHSLAGCGRSSEAIDELRRKLGPAQHFRVLDVTDAAAVTGWARELQEAGWIPDLVINNAALINRNAPLWEVSAEEFGQVIDVNLKGVHNMVRTFVPLLIDAGRGVIVNFSSGWGRSTSPEVGPYCTTKYGIEGYTAALAQELPAGLAAVSLNPGVIETDMLRSCFGGSAGAYERPDQWVQKAGPFILNLNATDNGGRLTAP